MHGWSSSPLRAWSRSVRSGSTSSCAADARIVEFSATGQIAERPFGIEFVLKNRVVRAETAADQSAFDITPRPGDIVLQGNASSNPMWDVIERALAAIPQQPSR